MGKRRAQSHPAQQCPCGSARAYETCCGRFLDQGMHAPTCETLMRSRYTAFVRGRRDYLLATWHPDTRPAHLDLDADRPPRWLGLKIIAASDQPPRVEFIARYRVAGKAHRLHERSRFVYAEGRWWYLDGELEPHEAGTRSDGASR